MGTRREGRRQRVAMDMSAGRQASAVGLMLALVLFLMPGLLVSQMEVDAALPADPSANAEVVSATGGSRDRGKVGRLAHKDGSVEELTMEDYLWGVVAAEMPANFELEALKAQAAAARTYTVELQSGTPKHENAHLCDDNNCCQAYIDRSAAQARWGLQAEEFSEKIGQAVAQTDGLGVLYQDQPIQAVFFSSAAGRTVDAVEVWGNSVAYLKGVESPEGEEVPNYHSQVTLTAEQVRQTILEQYPGADLSGAPESWFGAPTYNSAGGVAQMTVGGVTLTGSQIRSLLGLRSASFTVAYQDGSFNFQVTGYGHGVGMSQYGANAMAKDGANFEEILTWYYTDTQIGYLWE